ncbi:pentapeptide repeat-containing protein [Loktanella agnita]
MIALPLTLLRTKYNRQQTEATEAALLNNKLDAAFAGLFARKTATSRTRPVVYQSDGQEITTSETLDSPFSLPKGAIEIARGPWQILSEEVDDIITRATAIDRLEGLAQEHPEQADRIASVLSLYVRELSREYPPKECPATTWRNLNTDTEDCPGLDAHTIHREFGLHPDVTDPSSIRGWARSLKPVRSDMEKAVQTLGRMTNTVTIGSSLKQINLMGSNLQGFDLSGLNFEGAVLANCSLDGTRMHDTKMRAVNFGHASLIGAEALSTDLSETSFICANLECIALDLANLWKSDIRLNEAKSATLVQSNLAGVRINSSDFSYTNMNGALFDDDTRLFMVLLEGSSLKGVDLRKVQITPSEIEKAFGDASTLLPDDVYRPSHWPTISLDPLGFDQCLEDWRYKLKRDSSSPS